MNPVDVNESKRKFSIEKTAALQRKGILQKALYLILGEEGSIIKPQNIFINDKNKKLLILEVLEIVKTAT